METESKKKKKKRFSGSNGTSILRILKRDINNLIAVYIIKCYYLFLLHIFKVARIILIALSLKMMKMSVTVL